MAARSAQARKLRSLDPPLAAALHATLPLDCSPAQAELLRRTQAQLDYIDLRLSRPRLSAVEIDLLTRSRERQIKAWQLLAGLPSPGMRKPPKDRQRPLAIDLEPAPIPFPPMVVLEQPTPSDADSAEVQLETPGCQADPSDPPGNPTSAALPSKESLSPKPSSPPATPAPPNFSGSPQ